MTESVALKNTDTTSNLISSLDDDDVVAITAGNDKESLHTCIEQSFDLTSTVNKLIKKTGFTLKY